MSLIVSFAMLAIPGMSRPAARAALHSLAVDATQLTADVQLREALADDGIIGTALLPRARSISISADNGARPGPRGHGLEMRRSRRRRRSS